MGHSVELKLMVYGIAVALSITLITLKAIPYTKFENGIIRFSVTLQTNKQTNRRTWTLPTNTAGVVISAYVLKISADWMISIYYNSFVLPQYTHNTHRPLPDCRPTTSIVSHYTDITQRTNIIVSKKDIFSLAFNVC